ncbi:hypothetical protein MUK42_06706 [Musa troglodytarum]|uniref:Uncharacterized protein n=1 Tax=Musa troglodytarum TaxID=320322 RepID=A0A9E7HQT3_9LILI|nr:hypothetical protein MUK42_06706 [Musa troglodytarum]
MPTATATATATTPIVRTKRLQYLGVRSEEVDRRVPWEQGCSGIRPRSAAFADGLSQLEVAKRQAAYCEEVKMPPTERRLVGRTVPLSRAA